MKIIKRENKKEISTIYGNKQGTRTRLGADVYDEADNKEMGGRRLVSAELVRMNLPHPVDVIEYTYSSGGIIEKEYQQLETLRSQKELENDEKIFATLEKVLAKRDIKRIKTSSFVKEILSRIGDDPRFAYKKNICESRKNTEHSVHIYTVLAIIVASISATSNINFKAPIVVSFSNVGKELSITCEIISKSLESIRKMENFIRIPRLEAKLVYLSTLCKADGVRGTVKAIGNKAIFNYRIKEAPPEPAHIYAKDDEQSIIFSELLNAFNPIKQYEPDEDLQEGIDN